MRASLLFLLLFAFCPSLQAQPIGTTSNEIQVEELNIGGDIFSDFNEELEDAQIAEDERYYRYGRFYTVQIGGGVTTFRGNRGRAYENQNPSYTFGINYFLDFQNSLGMGFGYSKHQMDLYEKTNFSQRNTSAPGIVNINIFRWFFNYRYYIDTTDLGTALTFANPYLTGRLEYWYLSGKFEDAQLPDDTGGGIGLGLGIGLEFPVKIRQSYIGLEFLYHSINFHDRDTRKYQPLPDSSTQFGYDDLRGAGLTMMASYIWSW